MMVSDITGAVADTIIHGVTSNRNVDPLCPDYKALDGVISKWKDISPKKNEKSVAKMNVPTPSQRRSIEQFQHDVSSVRRLS